MADFAQVLLGVGVLIGFWWGVFAVIRLLEPQPKSSTASTIRPARATRTVVGPDAPIRASVSAPGPTACCPECTPGCQFTGLVSGQAWGRGDGWWGQPFGDDGPNTEAMVFWGDDCCPDCSRCQTCQGTGGGS